MLAAVAATAITLLAACTSTTGGTGTLAGAGPAPSALPSTSSPNGSTPGSGTPSSTPGVGPSVAAIDFEDCTDRIRPQLGDAPIFDRLSFGCGIMPVPVDYAKPTGDTLDIAVLRLHLTAQTPSKRIGSLVINPGGPGGSGVNAAFGVVTEIDPALLKSFDLVGFDPRGVGESAPVACISATTKDKLTPIDFDIRIPADFAAAKQQSADIAAGCTRKYPDLRYINTEATARDLDLLRQGLGDAGLNYLGYSYGTSLGAVYAHLFPRNIRVAVLDGAVDPTTSGLEGSEFQLAGFEQAFDQFAAYCRGDTACATLGDPRAAITAMEIAAKSTPIPSDDKKRAAGGGTVILAAVSALYSQDTWPDLRDALLQAKRGNSTGLVSLADDYNGRQPDGSYGNLMDANLAINCNDTGTDLTDAEILAAANRWATQYPLFGLNFAQSLFACQSWQPNRTPLPPADALSAPPILVIGTVHDPATPYAGAQHLADQLTVGVLLTWDGEGHTAYPKTSCIQEIVDGYLVTGIPPASGTECPAS